MTNNLVSSVSLSHVNLFKLLPSRFSELEAKLGASGVFGETAQKTATSGQNGRQRILLPDRKSTLDDADNDW